MNKNLLSLRNYFFKASNKTQNNVSDKWFNGNVTIFLICVIVFTLIYAVFLHIIGNTPNAMNWVKKFFYPSDGMDSWDSMIFALTHCKQFPDMKVYQELLIENGIKFQYPPTSLLLFDIPERITGISYLKISKIYNILSWISVILTVVFTSKILTLVIKKYNFTFSRQSSVSQFIIVFLLSLLFYPLIRPYILGQIQCILTLLATLVLYLYLSDRKKIAGICIGLICLIKPQLGLLFIWGLIRKEWSMVISGAITVISILLLSISLYGFHNHWDYLSALSYLSKHGEGFFPNQSVNGLMNRLLFNGNNLNWESNSFPPFNLTVYLSTLFSSIIFILSGLFWHYKNSKPNVVELSIMILCATMASPITWEHHYSILFPIFVLLSPFVLHYYQSKKWKILLFMLAFVVASQYLYITYKFADSYLNFLQSYVFFSAIMILIFLFSVSRKMKNKRINDNKIVEFKKITKQIKAFFLPILDVIIPKDKDEKWVFGTFFFIYACFSVLFFRKYGDNFPHFEVLNYDIRLWMSNFCNVSSVLPFDGGIKHPLFTVIFSPLNLLVYIAKLFYSGELPVQNLLILFFFNAVAALSITILYKYCVNFIRIAKTVSLFLCVLYALFAHVLLLSFIPETFQLSMLGLLFVVYLTTDSLLNQKKIPLITNILLFIYASGVTLSNGLKCVIAQLFQKGNFKEKRKSILLSGLITSILICISFLVNYMKGMVPDNNISEFIFSGQTDIISEMFFEPILFHHNYSLWGCGREVFAYNTIFPTIVNLILYAVIICAVLVNIRKRYVLLLLSLFGVDVLIHIICGFGIEDPYIYCLHWLFIFPLLIGWLYKEICNKKIKIGLTVLLSLLIFSLAVNNIPRIIELIY